MIHFDTFNDNCAVVVNENCLGIVNKKALERSPDVMHVMQVLHGSILRGYTKDQHICLVNSLDIIRLATEQDFDVYQVSSKGHI
jgi:hypothetical protein